MNTTGLSAICNGFGYREEDVEGALLGYITSEYCIDNLKDLQRYLRRDDPAGRHVFKQVCKWNVVSRDLVPILETYQNDRNLVINALKILVFLTMPVDPTSDDIFQQIEHLWELKAAIARNATIAVIVSLLEEPLEHLERDAFTEDDWKLVQLVLTFFRNVLAIQDISLQQKASGSSTQYVYLRDRFLELLFNENVMDLFLALTQHIEDSCLYIRQDNLLLLEIFYNILRGQEPDMIVKVAKKDNENIVTSVNYLKSIINEEEEKRKLNVLRNLERYSNFSGMFTRISMDGSKTLVKGNPTTPANYILLKAHKGHRGPLKRVAWDSGNLLPSKDNVLKMLYDFLNNFLLGCYNVLMQSTHEDIEKEHPGIQESDVLNFFQVACFVTAFQRLKFSDSKPQIVDATVSEQSQAQEDCGSPFVEDICGPIAATMNEGVIFLIISKWRHTFDSLKETKDYKSLSAAGSLMKNVIRMLDLVLKLLPEDSKGQKTARILLYKIFYDQTDQGFSNFVLNLIKSFDTQKQPKSDLVDLVEMMHVMLRLMESLEEHGTIRVARKARKRGKRKTPTVTMDPVADSLTNEKCPALDNDNSNNSKLLEDYGSVKEQLNSSFSTKKDGSMPSEALQEIDINLPESGIDNELIQMNVKISNDVNDQVYEDGSSSNDEHQPSTYEVDFNVSQLVSGIASNAAIQKLCWLLRFCTSNSPSTNHYIICMLQRICDDLDLSPLLYQLSFLTIFHDILSNEKSIMKCADVVNFLTKLIRNMMKKMKRNPLLFVDILFWKTRQECLFINVEDIQHDLHKLKREVNSMGIEGGTGLQNELGPASRKSLADSLGEDEADYSFPYDLDKNHMEDNSGEDLQNSSDKYESGKMDEGKQDLNSKNELNQNTHLEKLSRRKMKNDFEMELDANIRSLYEMFKGERQCLRLIAEALDPNGKFSPATIGRKLKQLGLKVASKKKIEKLHAPSLEGNELDCGDPPYNSNGPEQSTFVNSSLRKRIRVFSKEQELVIKDLFEKFKNHKRCSHMIANALDSNNAYTAAQISRKLKQLGLRRENKNSKYELHSGMEGSDKDKSDYETLAVIGRRIKKNRTEEKEAPVLKAHEARAPQRAVREDDLDDKPLRVFLRKKNQKLLSGDVIENKLDNSSIETVIDNNITATVQHPVGRDSLSRSTLEQSHQDGVTAAFFAPPDDGLEDDMQDEDSPLLEPHKEVPNIGTNLISMMLVDSDDDVDTIASRKSRTRRKLAIHVDIEDDD